VVRRGIIRDDAWCGMWSGTLECVVRPASNVSSGGLR
jgi:hypothetical protein